MHFMNINLKQDSKIFQNTFGFYLIFMKIITAIVSHQQFLFQERLDFFSIDLNTQRNSRIINQ